MEIILHKREEEISFGDTIKINMREKMFLAS